MSSQLSSLVAVLNELGVAHTRFAVAMLLQVGLLLLALACLDALVLRRTRAIVRYGVWSLVLVKLLLPVGLQGPLSVTGLLDDMPPLTDQVAAKEDHAATLLHAAPLQLARAANRGKEASTDREQAAERSAPIALPQAGFNFSELRWTGGLLICWLIGISLMMGLFVRRVWQVRELVRRASPASAALQSLLRDCQRLWGLESQSIRLLITDHLGSPAICGLWRATILVPASLADRLDTEQMRLVFIHELAHWKRFDLQVNCLQTLLQIAYFYSPPVWIANAILRRLREQAVDEAVLAVSQSSAERYSSTLLDIVALARQAPAFGLRLVGVVESSQALSSRIRRILAQPNPRRATLGFTGLAAMLLAGLVLLPLSGRRASATAADPPTVAAKNSDAAGSEKQNQTSAADQKGAAAPAATDVAEDEIAGTVTDEEENPLADALVDAWTWYLGNETKTDQDGRFRLKGLDPKEKAEVRISKEGYSPQHFPQRPPGAKDWVVKLGQKTYLEGTVTGTDGKPVAGAEIRASFGPVQGDGVLISEVITEGKSREDGTYRLYLQPESYDLQVSGGERGVFRTTNVAVKRNEAKPFDVQLRDGVRFEARVVDSVTGQPVEGFVLWRWRPPLITGRSDTEGKIVFLGLTPGITEFNCGGGQPTINNGIGLFRHGPFGRWWLEGSHVAISEPATGWQRNFDPLHFALNVGMQPAKIVVEQGVAVSGRVTDPNGQPVAGATVAPAKTGSGNSITGDTRYSVTTDKEGKYRVVLPASNKATYNFVVHDGKYEEWRQWANGVGAPMQTQPGQKIDGLDLQLTQPAIIRGRVVEGGKGVARRDVRTHAFDKLENRYYDPTTKTNADGTFEIKFVRPGKHYLQVEPFWLQAEKAPHGSKIIEVKAGDVLEGIELTAGPLEP